MSTIVKLDVNETAFIKECILNSWEQMSFRRMMWWVVKVINEYLKDLENHSNELHADPSNHMEVLMKVGELMKKYQPQDILNFNDLKDLMDNRIKAGEKEDTLKDVMFSALVYNKEAITKLAIDRIKDYPLFELQHSNWLQYFAQEIWSKYKPKQWEVELADSIDEKLCIIYPYLREVTEWATQEEVNKKFLQQDLEEAKINLEETK